MCSTDFVQIRADREEVVTELSRITDEIVWDLLGRLTDEYQLSQDERKRKMRFEA
jgi:hypothetical protein